MPLRRLISAAAMASAALLPLVLQVALQAQLGAAARMRLLDTQASVPTFVLEPLPYNFTALEPVIDTRTMELHHGVHEKTYVDKLNQAVQQAAAQGTVDAQLLASSTLPDLLKLVGTGSLPEPFNTQVRNNGGGHYNHQLFWKVMAPPGSANTSRDLMSGPLLAAVEGAFGSVDDMLAQFKTAGDDRFGSGWSWLCVAPAGSGTAGTGGNDTGGSSSAGNNSGPTQLLVITTVNQDSPIMPAARAQPPCTPILGIDVWEHAYYLKHGPKRADYTSDWLSIINWAQVSANYDAALAGDLGSIGTLY